MGSETQAAQSLTDQEKLALLCWGAGQRIVREVVVAQRQAPEVVKLMGRVNVDVFKARKSLYFSSLDLVLVFFPKIFEHISLVSGLFGWCPKIKKSARVSSPCGTLRPRFGLSHA